MHHLVSQSLLHLQNPDRPLPSETQEGQPTQRAVTVQVAVSPMKMHCKLDLMLCGKVESRTREYTKDTRPMPCTIIWGSSPLDAITGIYCGNMTLMTPFR